MSQQYYERRRKAIHLVDTMLEKQEPIEKIIYRVSTIFGFGEILVRRRIREIENLNMVLKEEKEKEIQNGNIRGV